MKYINNIIFKPKFGLGLLTALAMFSFNSVSAHGTHASSTQMASTTYKVMVMKHLCNANIKNISDFQNLEANRTPLAALANTVLNCPTTGLLNDEPVAGTVASPRTTYNFQLKNQDNSQIVNMNTNGHYMPGKVCESDLNVDADANGSIATTTCLDVSHYDLSIEGGAKSTSTTQNLGTTTMFSVTESAVPYGFHFGTVRFTPTSLSSNNDSESLTSVDTGNGIINLNMASDTDRMVMLHIYNFRDAATSTATTTPPTTDTQMLLELIRILNAKLDQLLIQVQMIINQNNNGNGGNNGNNGNNGGNGSGFSNARARAASTRVVIGDTNDFAGERYKPYEQVVMSLNGQTLKTMMSDKEGNWSTGSMVMPITPGMKTYIFRGVESNEQRSVNVQVTQIP